MTSATPLNLNFTKYYEGEYSNYKLPPAKEACRHVTLVEATKVLCDVAYNPAILALYSSLHGGILTDSRAMTLPFLDHMVHRGHSVFDTSTLVNGRLYRLDAHLERFYTSIQLAQINHPFESHEQIKEIIARTCAATKKKDAIVRFWLSAGGSDLAIHPSTCKPTFWVAVIEAGTQLSGVLLPSVEATVSASQVPLKPGLLCKAKTTNYMLNALCSIEATRHGGKLGLWIDDRGYLAEASIASVVVLSKNGVVKTPSLDNILSGFTMLRIHDLMQEVLETSDDMQQDVTHSGNRLPSTITGVARGPITLSELYDSQELMTVGGDCFVVPVIKLDNRVIGDGAIGPFATWLSEELLWEARCGTRFIDEYNFEENRSSSLHCKM